MCHKSLNRRLRKEHEDVAKDDVAEDVGEGVAEGLAGNAAACPVFLRV